MIQFVSAGIVKLGKKNQKYILCIFDKGKYHSGFHLQWVKASKLGEE